MKRIRKGVVAALAMPALLVLFAGLAAAADDSDKVKKDVVIENFSRIEWDNPDLKIQIKVVGDRRSFRVGDEIEFKFRANKDAYVTLVDVGTSGKVHVIFPNRWNRDNKVEGGRWYSVPPRRSDYNFQVRGPAGVNYVKALACLDRYEFFPGDWLTSGEGPFDEFKDPEFASKDIGIRLGKRDRKIWSEASTNFTIRDRRGRDFDDDDDYDRDRDRRRHRDRDRDSWDRHDERFTVKLWTDRKTYRKGDPVTFFFYAERDCHLNLVDFGTSGRTRIIFPNRYQRDNFVRGGTVVEIPDVKDDKFRFRVEGPEGIEMVKAVATRHRYHIYKGDYDFDKYEYQPWEDEVGKIESDIQTRLRDLPDDYYVRAKTEFRVLP